MRSSKSRSRSKSNRQRTLGNIINRVFDSSGPEGKVRGTPQQIIDKYLMLARDAQLSNDRVAEQNFLQHAEHYTRMLGEAQRETSQDPRGQQGGFGQPQPGQNGNGQQGGQQGGQNGTAERNQEGGQQERGQQRNDRQPQRDRNPERGGEHVPERSFEPAREPMTDPREGGEESGLVDTPEMRPQPPRPDHAPQAERRVPRAPKPQPGAGTDAQAEPAPRRVEAPATGAAAETGAPKARAPRKPRAKPAPEHGSERAEDTSSAE
ncbi:MAG: DUF4167 domain-containing protein [Defluviimonas sp.]|nr:DUF4167 domain-containing protein [Defluviimonas sp.]